MKGLLKFIPSLYDLEKFQSQITMKRILLSAMLLGIGVAYAHAQAPEKPADLTTLKGKVYKQAKVFRVEPDGITYIYAGGMSKIDFTDLSDEIRKKYGYDPAKAAAFAKEDEATQVQLQQVGDTDAATVRAKRDREEYLQNLAKLLVASQLQVRAKISSINKDGILAYIMIGDIFPASSGRDGLDIGHGMRWWNKTDELNESVVIKCKTNPQAVDGDVMYLTVYPCGVDTRYGHKKCYTTDPVEAGKFFGKSPDALNAEIAGRTDWAP